MVDFFKKDDISITREYEFYQGFVRLKVAVKNNSKHVITDVKLDFKYDQNIFFINEQKDCSGFENGAFLIANIRPKNSSTCAILFDPLICSNNTEIGCLISYTNSKGKIRSEEMKPISIKITCPLLQTDSDINIGTLKELVTDLMFKDNRVYALKENFNDNKLEVLLRDTIQRHNVRYVRTYAKKDGSQTEVWFYGNTKLNNSKIVLRTSIVHLEDNNQYIDFFAAAEKQDHLVGLLAEMGNELKHQLEEFTQDKKLVHQVFNIKIIDSVVTRPTLIFNCDDGCIVAPPSTGPIIPQKYPINPPRPGPKGKKDGDKKMDLTYDDILNYLNEMKEFIMTENIDFDDTLHIDEQRKKMVSNGFLVKYGTIVDMCGFDKEEDNKAYTKALLRTLPEILDEINRATDPFLLSALVVNGDTYIPGNKYFGTWHKSSTLSIEEKVNLWVQDFKELMNS